MGALLLFPPFFRFEERGGSNSSRCLSRSCKASSGGGADFLWRKNMGNCRLPTFSWWSVGLRGYFWEHFLPPGRLPFSHKKEKNERLEIFSPDLLLLSLILFVFPLCLNSLLCCSVVIRESKVSNRVEKCLPSSV